MTGEGNIVKHGMVTNALISTFAFFSPPYAELDIGVIAVDNNRSTVDKLTEQMSKLSKIVDR